MTKQEQPDLEDVVARVVEDVLDPAQTVNHNVPLQKLGLDSLTLTQVLLAIEEETGIWLDESYLTPEHLENVSTLAACLREQRENGD